MIGDFTGSRLWATTLRMAPSIVILGYAQAAAYIRSAPIDSLISIAGSREHAVEVEVAHRLDLSFDDAPSQLGSDPLEDYRARQRRRQAEAVGLRLDPPTEKHAQCILDFADSIKALEGTLLCHCQGGVSRSPAAALLCLACWSSPGQETACVQALFATCNHASPHLGLVTFGDRLLERDGRLIAALHSQRA